jgi:signal transduction histidine kinase
VSDDPLTPAAFAPLEQARRRQEATRRLLRTLALAVVVVVTAGGSSVHPHPGLSGDRLGVLIALVGFVVGWLGTITVRRGQRRPARVAGALVVLIVSSSALVWLQPSGPGFLGAFVAVAMGAMLLRGPLRYAPAAVAFVGLALAGVLASHRALSSVALSELGVMAFFIVALLAERLREGQEKAEALLVELAQSREGQARAAALAERQRLAREVHDVLAHSLSALVLQLDGARLLARRGEAEPQLSQAVERAHHLAKAGLDEARRAIGMLRDEELPGPERLTALSLEFERDSGVPCELQVAGELRELDSDARLTVYRVAQEALTNVRKHARPARVELHLGYEPDGTRLTIEDFAANGDRAPAAALDNGGYGLTGMRERAELLGGMLSAAATERGFRVELWVPA